MKYSFAILLDTNVFGQLILHETPFQKLREIISHCEDGSSQYQYMPFSTDLAVLEYLGVKIPDPPQIAISDKNLTTKEILQAAYRNTVRYYFDSKDFTYELIRSRVNDRRQYLTKDGLELFDKLVTRCVGDLWFETMIKRLSWDFAFGVEIPTSIREDAWFQVCLSIRDEFDAGLNVPIFKLIANLTKQMLRTHPKMKLHPQWIQDETQNALSLKPIRDRLDSGIIQAAVLGWYFGPQGRLPVHCLTADPSISIEPRLVTMLGAMIKMSKAFEALPVTETTPLRSPVYGYIHCLDGASLNCEKLFDAGSYLDTLKSKVSLRENKE